MVNSWERIVAVLCYLGAMRMPFVALWSPGLAFTLPGGLAIAGAAWAYGRKRSTFLQHHGLEGLKWALEANLGMVVLALVSKGFYYVWYYAGLSFANTLWHLSAGAIRWVGLLVSILTVAVMVRAFRGETGDALAPVVRS